MAGPRTSIPLTSGSSEGSARPGLPMTPYAPISSFRTLAALGRSLALSTPSSMSVATCRMGTCDHSSASRPRMRYRTMWTQSRDSFRLPQPMWRADPMVGPTTLLPMVRHAFPLRPDPDHIRWHAEGETCPPSTTANAGFRGRREGIYTDERPRKPKKVLHSRPRRRSISAKTMPKCSIARPVSLYPSMDSRRLLTST